MNHMTVDGYAPWDDKDEEFEDMRDPYDEWLDYKYSGE